LPNWRDNEPQKRQWISPKARPGCRTSPDPAAVPYFGLDWTARPLQKAELPMVLCRRLFVALLGLSAAVWASPGLAQTGGTVVGTAGIALTTTDFTLTLQQQMQTLAIPTCPRPTPPHT